jgi:hypothetical protein
MTTFHVLHKTETGRTAARVLTEDIEADIDAPDASSAIAAFIAERLGGDASRWLAAWHRTVVIPGDGDAPERMLMNYEKDPNAEVADGWLSNLAAAFGNLSQSLAWQPEFCTTGIFEVRCPRDGSVLREIHGRYGVFVSCQCGWKASRGTKKYDANRHFIRWCGTKLIASVNHLGVPYRACPSCSPDAVENLKRPVRELT